jgi:PKHD-type hydroxylase
MIMAAPVTRSPSTTDRAVNGPSSGLIGWERRRGARGFAPQFPVRTIGGPRKGHLHLDWVRCEARLSAAQCARVIAIGRQFNREAPTVVGQEALAAHRVGHVYMLPPDGPAEPIYQMLWDVAADAAARHYGILISGITRMPHYVEYVARYGHFHWHNDYSHESEESPRKLTVIIQLSDSDEYEGGDLEIFNARPEPAPRERGTIVCLPSFVTHRVTPITRGVRRIVVAWIAGPRLR